MKGHQNAQSPSWPKVQDSIGYVFDHYESVILNSSNIRSAQYSAKQDGKWGVVDAKNQLYFPFEYDTIVSNYTSIALKKGGEHMIYDTSRTLIATIESELLRPIFSSFYTSERKGKLALVNPNGMLILDHRFDQISGPKDASYFLGNIDNNWTAYDMAGEKMDSTSTASEAARWLSSYTMSLKAYGPLKIGMSKSQIEKAIGWTLTKIYDEPDCLLFSLGDNFLNVSLMLNTSNDGKTLKLERIYIYAPEVLTRSGIGIGSSKDDLLETYGDKISEHQNIYDDQALDLFYVPMDRRDRNFRLHFLHRNGAIESLSVGRLPSIEFIEGCL